MNLRQALRSLGIFQSSPFTKQCATLASLNVRSTITAWHLMLLQRARPHEGILLVASIGAHEWAATVLLATAAFAIEQAAVISPPGLRKTSLAIGSPHSLTGLDYYHLGRLPRRHQWQFRGVPSEIQLHDD